MQHAINLTILRQVDAVVVSLTDARMLATLGTTDVSEAMLDGLRLDVQALLQRAACDGSDGAKRERLETAVRELGQRLSESLLPSAIRSFLSDSPPRSINLQLDAELTWIPWELVLNGGRYLGEKFRVCRRIVTNEESAPLRTAPTREGPLRVHVLTVGASDACTAAEGPALVGRLLADEGIACSRSDASQLGQGEHPDIFSHLDVLHCIVPSSTSADEIPMEILRRGLHPVATPAAALVIVQAVAQPARPAPLQARRAVAAARWGFNVLTLNCGPADAACADFVQAVYRNLANGASVGEALRGARSHVHRLAGAAALARLQAQFYGEGDIALILQDRRAPGEDSLRQVTVMSFDLVESTRLLGQIGAERYSEILQSYHHCCLGILIDRGGKPDDPQGNDGLMCYFGLPVAREDAAGQAVRAGLEIIEAVKALGLSVRVGICTGRVVIRDGQPVGSAVHFAARLQAIALPGTLVVGESTRKLVKGRYRFTSIERDLPPLKGFVQHEGVFRVALPAEDDVDPEFAADAPRLSPFVGRSDEMLALERHWAQARAGTLRVVRIVGEAGIGKSRLLREFKRSLAAQGHGVFECRCAAGQENSAFHPMIEALRNELHIGIGDSGESVRFKLGRLVAQTSAPDDAVAVLAELMTVPLPADHPLQRLPAERLRQSTMDMLVELGKLRVRDAAGCMIVEDVHWIDPSTGDLIDRLAVEAGQLPLLILLTSRPEPESRWHPRVAVHDEELSAVSTEAARMLVVGAGGDTRLPTAIVHLLAARTDGVPLFIEESTRMAIEVGAGRVDAGEALMQSVPTTIQDLLGARLDRLDRAKQVAQICGTIGREFSMPLLQAVLRHPDSPFQVHDLPAQLAALMRSGMLVRRGDPETGRYRFKHALMRDAAYRSLLERDRKRLHRIVAQMLREQFRELSDAQPESLAFHLTEAGDLADALGAWELAARRAASRSAHVEAINHLSAALAVLERSPIGVDRERTELRLQLLLATRLIATEGYGAERVERVYARAMDLARTLGDDAAQMKVLLGLEAYHSARAEFGKAMAIAVEARAKAQGDADAIHRVQLKWAVANLVMHQGDMATAVLQMDECLAEYDRLEHRASAVQDPGVMCLCYSAWALWQLGHPDQAMQRAQSVVARAEHMKHRFSLGEAYGFRAAIQLFRGEGTAALDSAARAIEICEEGGFSMWLSLARLIRGRVLAEGPDAASGNEEMRQAHALWASTGTVLTTPFYLALRSEGLALGGRPEEGIELLDQALAVIERCGERYYEAEVRRLYGTLVRQCAARAGIDRDAEAESWLRSALASAQSRELLSLSLRAATSLAQLWRSLGNHDPARQVLNDAYRCITEGAETRDLVHARELLTELRAATATAD